MIVMANRSLDWMKQADADLRHARNSLQAGDFEWCCFSAQQGAEKAVKAVFLRFGRDAWGHTLSILLGNLAEIVDVAEDLIDKAKILDKHYILTRYPNGFDSGAPTDFYTRKEAETAVQLAEETIEFCRNQIH